MINHRLRKSKTSNITVKDLTVSYKVPTTTGTSNLISRFKFPITNIKKMISLPDISEYPFAVEITNLQDGTTHRTYHKDLIDVHNAVSSTDEDIEYRCGWNRELHELICDSHKNEQ